MNIASKKVIFVHLTIIFNEQGRSTKEIHQQEKEVQHLESTSMSLSVKKQRQLLLSLKHI